MLLWAILFFLISIVAGILAYTGIAVAVTFYAKVFFFIATVSFMIFLILIFLRKASGNDKDNHKL
jgi:uncharacterized membrane protein YtjA (UPF0391 family)